jgi:N-acetylglutamate synthase-like GNAT family acetyltransferase
VQLTRKGQEAFSMLNARSHNGIEAMLNTMSTEDQHRMVESMERIEKVLGARSEQKVPYILRLHQPGDMGWVVNRHGVLYTEEYGWDEQFEGFVADIVSKFIQNYNPKRERCWIAEKHGENIGSVFLVQRSDTVAKLRMLIVDPKARGLGVGTRLVEECLRFARRTGYKKVVLWTNSILLEARHIYEKFGFELVESEPHHSFGQDLIGENWELAL